MKQTACLSLTSGNRRNLSEQSRRNSRSLIANSYGLSMLHRRSNLVSGTAKRMCRSAARETPPLHGAEGGHAAASQEGGDLAAHSRDGEEGELMRSASVTESFGEGENGAGLGAESGEGKEGGVVLPFWLRYLQQWYPWRVRKHLQQLKERAEAEPVDAANQALYLQQLNKADRSALVLLRVSGGVKWGRMVRIPSHCWRVRETSW